MPKFLVTSGSYFQPYTYDELAKPIIQTVEAHNATQDAYDQLSMETAALGRYITDNQGDVRAKKMYDDYLSRLNSLQDNLWNNGYNAATRRDLSSARAGYASDISRLQSAIKTRQERSKEYWDARHKNPDLVTGSDPGAFGLDSYLNDDNFGQNWYSYNGKEFEAGVATEVQAKAQELLDSDVVRDPALVDQLTRIISHGVTNADIALASPIVDALIDSNSANRNKFYRDNNVSASTQILVESLIGRYDAVGAREANLSPEERNRLVNYGKAGWAHGVMKPDVKDFDDPVYEEAKQKRLYDYQHRLSKDLADYKYNLEHPDGGSGVDENPYSFQNIIDPHTVTGSNYENKRKQVDKLINPGEETLLISSDGKHEVRNHADASELVFSGDLRRKMFPLVGFDIGLDPTDGILGTDKTPRSRYLHGEIVGADGKEYLTEYNPYKKWKDADGVEHTGAILLTEKNGNGDARLDVDLTLNYERARKIYENNERKYKNEDADIYKMATIDPKKQKKIYDDDEIDFSVPLTSYSSTVMSKRDNSERMVYDTYVAEIGTDMGKYIQRMTNKFSSNFVVDGKDGDRATKMVIHGTEYNARSHDDQPTGIHLVDEHGNLSKKAVGDLNSVFTFKGGLINNISKYYVNEDAIKNGYIIAKTSKSSYPVSIPISYFNDSALTGAFASAQARLQAIYEDKFLPYEVKNNFILRTQDMLASSLRSIIGPLETTKSPTGTENKVDTN